MLTYYYLADLGRKRTRMGTGEEARRGLRKTTGSCMSTARLASSLSTWLEYPFASVAGFIAFNQNPERVSLCMYSISKALVTEWHRGINY